MWQRCHSPSVLFLQGLLPLLVVTGLTTDYWRVSLSMSGLGHGVFQSGREGVAEVVDA